MAQALHPSQNPGATPGDVPCDGHSVVHGTVHDAAPGDASCAHSCADSTSGRTSGTPASGASSSAPSGAISKDIPPDVHPDASKDTSAEPSASHSASHQACQTQKAPLVLAETSLSWMDSHPGAVTQAQGTACASHQLQVPPTAPAQTAPDEAGRNDAENRESTGLSTGTHHVRLCIVTGLSGSGKSTAMQVFEDLMYFTVDGLPASMAPEMVALMNRPSMAHFKGIALGLDIRQSTFLNEIEDVLEKLRLEGHNPQLIFLEADTPEIMRRYATTRRPHPLEREGIGLETAVLMERRRLAQLRSQADMVINTTRFSIHDLRRIMQKRFRDGQNNARSLRVFVLSFGFKHGVPKEADYVFDLRFLPNPYFVSELRAKSGLEQEVADYVFATPKAREFLGKLQDLIFFILPLMEGEGRYRLTLAFGCTGGHHRSVAVAEAIGRAIAQAGFPTTIEHRHLELG